MLGCLMLHHCSDRGERELEAYDILDILVKLKELNEHLLIDQMRFNAS